MQMFERLLNIAEIRCFHYVNNCQLVRSVCIAITETKTNNYYEIQ